MLAALVALPTATPQDPGDPARLKATVGNEDIADVLRLIVEHPDFAPHVDARFEARTIHFEVIVHTTLGDTRSAYALSRQADGWHVAPYVGHNIQYRLMGWQSTWLGVLNGGDLAPDADFALCAMKDDRLALAATNDLEMAAINKAVKPLLNDVIAARGSISCTYAAGDTFRFRGEAGQVHADGAPAGTFRVPLSAGTLLIDPFGSVQGWLSDGGYLASGNTFAVQNTDEATLRDAAARLAAATAGAEQRGQDAGEHRHALRTVSVYYGCLILQVPAHCALTAGMLQDAGYEACAAPLAHARADYRAAPGDWPVPDHLAAVIAFDPPRPLITPDHCTADGGAGFA